MTVEERLRQELEDVATGLDIPPLPDVVSPAGRRPWVPLLVAAAAVAILVLTTATVLRTTRSAEPPPGQQTPTTTPSDHPTVTQTTTVSGTPGPREVAFLREYDGGFFAVGDDRGLAVWRRDEHGWHELTWLHNDDVSTAPDGRYLLISRPNTGAGVDRDVSEDGGRTLRRLDLPGACTAADTPALLSTGIYVAAGPCGTVETKAGWRGYWQPRGSSTWESRPMVDLSLSGTYIHAWGDRLVARTSEPDGDGIAQLWVSHDTGTTWHQVPYPCLRPTHTDWPYYVDGVVYKVCFEDAGNVVFTLGDDDTWTPAITLPTETVDSAFQELGVLPLGGNRWLAETSTRLLLVTPEGSTPVDPPWDVAQGEWRGIATVGSDIFLVAGRDNGSNRVPLWVSHDGGFTWNQEE